MLASLTVDKNSSGIIYFLSLTMQPLLCMNLKKFLGHTFSNITITLVTLGNMSLPSCVIFFAHLNMDLVTEPLAPIGALT